MACNSTGIIFGSTRRDYKYGQEQMALWHGQCAANLAIMNAERDREQLKANREAIKRASAKYQHPLSWARMNPERVRELLATQARKEVES